ncbi:MAG: transketolase C-terminal domain-containing protein [Microgenomates group bacterium]|jgi:transketolase
MRLSFSKALINANKKYSNIHLSTADLGFEVFEEFIEKFPERFTNAGISEANMVGMAAGMAHSGLIPVCYSIVPFLTFRAFEQIRNDVCYPNLNVKIVGVGGGYGYSLNGQSHCAIEDISLMRSLPNMTVICPGDPLEAYRAAYDMFSIKGPVYLRLGKKGEPILSYEYIGAFCIGKTVEIKKGKDLVIFTTGNMLESSIIVEEKLQEVGIDASLIHVHTIKPLDKDHIRKIIGEHSKLITIEEHNITGGLGSAIAEINVASNDCLRHQLIIGIDDKYHNVGGSQKYLRSLDGLDVNSIIQRTLTWLKS